MSSRRFAFPKTLFAVAFAATAILAFASPATASFSSPAPFPVSPDYVTPTAVATADLNADGNLDLVSANAGGNNASVLLGNGAGGFSVATQTAYAAGASSVAIGLLNADTIPDLAVAGRTSNKAYVFIGNGDGTFNLPQTLGFSTGSSPTGIVIGDFYGDGANDLATADSTGGEVAVLPGNGDGTFDFTQYLNGIDTPQSIVAGDFDGDSDQDLAVTQSNSGSVAVLLQNATGFENPVSYAVGSTPRGLAAADLDGDGDLDLAAANRDSGNTSVLLGTGSGTFGGASTYGTGGLAWSVAINDLTADGIPDLAVTRSDLNPNNSRVVVLPGIGDGTFGSGANYATGDDPRGITTGDFDNDLNPDIATANFSGAGNLLSVLTNLAPVAESQPTSLAFGSQDVGTTSAQSEVDAFPVNEGENDLVVRKVAFSGANPGDFGVTSLSESCPSSVPVGGACNFQVTFSPSVPGARSATLVITYNGGASPLTVPLTGTGVDTTPPDTIIDSGPSGTISISSATFTFHGDPAMDTAKIMCQLDAATFADCTSPKTFSGLADGPHMVAFRAQDAAGNQDPTPASRSFTVDTVVPPTPIPTPTPATKAKISKVTVRGPAKAMKGQKKTYTVKVTNSGDAAATGVKLKVSGKGIKLRKTIGSIATGKTKVLKVKLKFKKPSKVKATFRVTSSNAGTKTVKKKIKVRK